METLLWGFMYLVLDYSTVPEGTMPLEASGAYVFVTAEQCERQRLQNSEVTDDQGRVYLAVSDQCFATPFARSDGGGMAGPPAPALAVNTHCAYDAAVRLVDPALPSAGLTGAARKARQRVRIATRKAVVADIHAGAMGDQDLWSTLCPTP